MKQKSSKPIGLSLESNRVVAVVRFFRNKRVQIGQQSFFNYWRSNEKPKKTSSNAIEHYSDHFSFWLFHVCVCLFVSPVRSISFRLNVFGRRFSFMQQQQQLHGPVCSSIYSKIQNLNYMYINRWWHIEREEDENNSRMLHAFKFQFTTWYELLWMLCVRRAVSLDIRFARDFAEIHTTRMRDGEHSQKQYTKL